MNTNPTNSGRCGGILGRRANRETQPPKIGGTFIILCHEAKNIARCHLLHTRISFWVSQSAPFRVGALSPPKTQAPADSSQTETLLKQIDTGYYGRPDCRSKPTKTTLTLPPTSNPTAASNLSKNTFSCRWNTPGSGRGLPEPEHVDTVKIGFLGPIMPTVSVATGGKSHNEETLGIAMLRACRLAIEEANAKGGYLKRKIPFELCVRNDNALWGASGSEVIHLAYKDNVWAIIGGIDGANTHIAIRVALKIEIPWMTPGDLDPTYIETNIPWVMRCIGDDRQLNYLLVDYALRKMDYKRPCIIRSSNRYGRFGVREIRDSFRRLERPVVIEMAYKGGAENFDMQLDRIAEYKPDVIFHWGNGDDGARVLNAIRARGWKQPFLTCDRAVSESFSKSRATTPRVLSAVIPGIPSAKTRNWTPLGKPLRIAGASNQTPMPHTPTMVRTCSSGRFRLPD